MLHCLRLSIVPLHSVSLVIFSIDLTAHCMHDLFINKTRLNLELGLFLKSVDFT